MSPEILNILNNAVGFSGLRDLHSLVQIQQKTLEKRLIPAAKRLPKATILSIYMTWLLGKTPCVLRSEAIILAHNFCVTL